MKTVVITGASRGIGAATAEYFALRGWRVIVNYFKSESRAREVADKIAAAGGEAHIFRADVGNTDDCRKLIGFAAGFGSIDALVNNAAIDEMLPFDMLTIERERRLFDVNLFGAMDCTRFALPHMIREKSGSIINVSSIWGQVGASCEVQYSTSKAALIGFTKSLAKELAPSGIRVNCVAPGAIDTEMNHNVSPEDMAAFCEEIPMGRMGTAAEVAEAIFFLWEGGYITGQVLGVNGGM